MWRSGSTGWCRERCDRDRRARAAPRGRRVLRRQQVPLPGPVRAGAHRPHPLGRRADHQRRDHRHPGHHPRAGARRRGGRAGARRALRLCVVGDPDQRGLHSATFGEPRGRGRRRPTWPPRPTSCTSTRRSVGWCRSSPLATPTSGREPRASTRSSRSWPTAARSSSTPRTSARSHRCTRGSSTSATTAATTSSPSGTASTHHPWGELAHSTHLFGAGTYDPVDGERQRVKVTLATGIPEEVVHRVNLSYLDPTTVDLDTLAADPDTLVVPDAGEVLFRAPAARIALRPWTRTRRPEHGDPATWLDAGAAPRRGPRPLRRGGVPGHDDHRGRTAGRADPGDRQLLPALRLEGGPAAGGRRSGGRARHGRRRGESSCGPHPRRPARGRRSSSSSCCRTSGASIGCSACCSPKAIVCPSCGTRSRWR